ncbi:hypothetical protein D3C80_1335450 [compost metagenome]
MLINGVHQQLGHGWQREIHRQHAIPVVILIHRHAGGDEAFILSSDKRSHKPAHRTCSIAAVSLLSEPGARYQIVVTGYDGRVKRGGQRRNKKSRTRDVCDTFFFIVGVRDGEAQ